MRKVFAVEKRDRAQIKVHKICYNIGYARSLHVVPVWLARGGAKVVDHPVYNGFSFFCRKGPSFPLNPLTESKYQFSFCVSTDIFSLGD